MVPSAPIRRFGQAPIKVVVAGSGVGGLELVLALRSLAADQVAIELIAPRREFTYRPLSVLEPFNGTAPRFDIGAIADDHGAKLHVDGIAAVDSDRRRVRTRDGKDIRYDALVIATGARAREVVPGALTFGADVRAESFAVLTDELERGVVRKLVFALPGGVPWSLPLYELAFNMASHLRSRGVTGFELTVVTPEDRPLGLFGQQASDAVRQLLDENGIHFMAATHPMAVEPGGLTVVPNGYVAADRVVAMPRLEGLVPAGLPRDDGGFLPTDSYGQVRGVADVYAAGDCTSFPVKQGGLAAAQADVVAEVIAARAGVNVEPNPFPPVLHGMLLTGNGARYLSARVTRGPGIESEVDSDPLWWPPAKIFARHLGPYLATRGASLQVGGERSEVSTAFQVDLGDSTGRRPDRTFVKPLTQ